jgi:hypothetical protein
MDKPNSKEEMMDDDIDSVKSERSEQEDESDDCEMEEKKENNLDLFLPLMPPAMIEYHVNEGSKTYNNDSLTSATVFLNDNLFTNDDYVEEMKINIEGSNISHVVEFSADIRYDDSNHNESRIITSDNYSADNYSADAGMVCRIGSVKVDTTSVPDDCRECLAILIPANNEELIQKASERIEKNKSGLTVIIVKYFIEQSQIVPYYDFMNPVDKIALMKFIDKMTALTIAELLEKKMPNPFVKYTFIADKYSSSVALQLSEQLFGGIHEVLIQNPERSCMRPAVRRMTYLSIFWSIGHIYIDEFESYLPRNSAITWTERVDGAFDLLKMCGL